MQAPLPSTPSSTTTLTFRDRHLVLSTALPASGLCSLFEPSWTAALVWPCSELLANYLAAHEVQYTIDRLRCHYRPSLFWPVCNWGVSTLSVYPPNSKVGLWKSTITSPANVKCNQLAMAVSFPLSFRYAPEGLKMVDRRGWGGRERSELVQCF